MATSMAERGLSTNVTATGKRKGSKKTARYFDDDIPTQTDELPSQRDAAKKPHPEKRPHPAEGEEEEEEEEEAGGEEGQSRRRVSADWASRFLKSREKKDPFEGPAPIAKSRIQKYSRGQQNKLTRGSFPDLKVRKKLERYEEKHAEAAKQAARTELLLPEESGFLEAEEGEETFQISQRDISEAVDLASATKSFELRMDKFGPYRMDFTRNGRHLLLGGRLGHLAAINWTSKKLAFEINVMETIREVRWLHLETMLAVAQKKWLYMYDNHGVELHCIKSMNDVLRMEFLPHHFLLAASTAHGVLQYLDTSVGKMVSEFPTKCGRLDVMTQNPYNAILHLGHTDGTVTLWSPNIKEPVVKMLCHKAAVRALAVDRKGLYMATAGIDRQLKIFDVRTYKPLQVYRIARGASELRFSQRGLLAASLSDIVEVYKDCCRTTMDKPYMRHTAGFPVSGIQFCPFEDVLGVAHAKGYASLLIPGSGEPNFDALETNPYQSKRQRREFEVKSLLEKIQPEMITLDPQAISQVDRATMEQRRKDREELFGAAPRPKFEPRFKKKGRSSAGKKEKRKQGHKEEEKRAMLQKESFKGQEEEKKQKEKKSQEKSLKHQSALDRFKN